MNIGKWVIDFGVQDRGYNGKNPTWFGFSYGCWLPRVIMINDDCFHLMGHWLCFHGLISKYQIKINGEK
jgi:hypothetical protein